MTMACIAFLGSFLAPCINCNVSFIARSSTASCEIKMTPSPALQTATVSTKSYEVFSSDEVRAAMSTTLPTESATAASDGNSRVESMRYQWKKYEFCTPLVHRYKTSVEFGVQQKQHGLNLLKRSSDIVAHGGFWMNQITDGVWQEVIIPLEQPQSHNSDAKESARNWKKQEHLGHGLQLTANEEEMDDLDEDKSSPSFGHGHVDRRKVGSIQVLPHSDLGNECSPQSGADLGSALKPKGPYLQCQLLFQPGMTLEHSDAARRELDLLLHDVQTVNSIRKNAQDRRDARKKRHHSEVKDPEEHPNLVGSAESMSDTAQKEQPIPIHQASIAETPRATSPYAQYMHTVKAPSGSVTSSPPAGGCLAAQTDQHVEQMHSLYHDSQMKTENSKQDHAGVVSARQEGLESFEGYNVPSAHGPVANETTLTRGASEGTSSSESGLSRKESASNWNLLLRMKRKKSQAKLPDKYRSAGVTYLEDPTLHMSTTSLPCWEPDHDRRQIDAHTLPGDRAATPVPIADNPNNSLRKHLAHNRAIRSAQWITDLWNIKASEALFRITGGRKAGNEPLDVLKEE
jgi:hypothetical protein